MTMQAARQGLYNNLLVIYDPGEAGAITDWVMEHLTGIEKNRRSISGSMALTESQLQQLNGYQARLLKNEPVQYVLNESWFCGFLFFVDNHVLIPRPETEELVETVISNLKFPLQELTILDIGSGSGCIPVALKRKLRKSDVWGCDISDTALSVARRNAETLGAAVHFEKLDFLDRISRSRLPHFDIIVSNPPYIPWGDRSEMQPNVVDFEPQQALFVPDEDPLVFYKAIADFGKSNLREGGNIFLEIHEDFGNKLTELFLKKGYRVREVRKDINGKERILHVDLII